MRMADFRSETMTAAFLRSRSEIGGRLPNFRHRQALPMKSLVQRVWFLSAVAAMGGFLFGYDTAVINGGEQQIQEVWKLSGTLHGLVMSAALWGTVLGAFSGGKITDRLGQG